MKPSDVLSAKEREYLLLRSDFLAWAYVLGTWSLTFGILLLVGHFPSIITIVFAWIVLPGRQLSLAVLMHEAGHGSLFKTKILNKWVGQWLCALPTLGDLESYARGHSAHHRFAGTDEDPDLPNYRAYPIKKSSLYRKWIRDLTGQTGFKLMVALTTGAGSQMSKETVGSSNLLAKQTLVHLVFALILVALGVGWTWFIWMGTFLTSYMWVVRLRQVGEHAAVPDLCDTDVRMNTRTVDAPFWQCFLLAPNNVNMHMEHHFMAGVPCYNLPKLREMLKSKGLIDEVPEVTGYGQVLKLALVD